MFEIVEKKGQIVINLTRNDSCEISTCPFIDADENKLYDKGHTTLDASKTVDKELLCVYPNVLRRRTV